MEFDIHRKEVTGSTNDDVRELAAAGARPGCVVRALRQESGHGQWNRVWVSPEGGLYFSALLRPGMPERDLPALSPLLAEAVADVVREVSGAAPQDVWVKPPNDVKCAAGKLCGISLEAKGGLLVLGLGVNVFHPQVDIVTDGRNVPAYVCDLAPRAGSRNEAAFVAPAREARVGYLDALMERLLHAIAACLEAAERAAQ